ncbi:uncharacterized protein J3R85_001279 [Psidium guajava]|nr:uncharacterized protein J3R85_001279 [Psidium guajava]
MRSPAHRTCYSLPQIDLRTPKSRITPAPTGISCAMSASLSHYKSSDYVFWPLYLLPKPFAQANRHRILIASASGVDATPAPPKNTQPEKMGASPDSLGSANEKGKLHLH